MEAVSGYPMVGKNNKSRNTSFDWKAYKRSLIPIVVIILSALVFHALSDGAFITPRNLSNLSRQVCVNLTLAIGMTLVIITSGIDLSVGSVLALAGMAAAISQVHWNWAEMGVLGAILSFMVSIAVGGLSGSLTGVAISHFRITPFIVTLGMMVITRGMTLIVSSAQAVAPLGESLGRLSTDYFPPYPSFILFMGTGVVAFGLLALAAIRKSMAPMEMIKTAVLSVVFCGGGISVFCAYRGIPYMVFISVLCAVAGAAVLKYTRYGRFLYAVGGNREAAELSGVPVAKTLWVTYFIMGCLSGLAGVMDAARVNGAVPSAGELGELDAIAAVVIGGTSLMGGVGTITGTVLGVLIMGILNNGMSLVGVSEHYQKVFKGIVIILAVYLDLRSKKSK